MGSPSIRIAPAVFLALVFAVGCAKVPNDPNDAENPVWNERDVRAPVSALQAPTIYLHPSVQTVRPGQAFDLEIRVMNFGKRTPPGVKGMHLVLQLPPVTAMTADTLRYGDFFTFDGAGVVGWTRMSDDTLAIDVARVGKPAASTADSGGVARVRLRMPNSGTFEVRLLPERCLLRDGANRPTTDFQTRNALVEVKP